MIPGLIEGPGFSLFFTNFSNQNFCSFFAKIRERKKYLQMVSGMNHLWNSGRKDVILATAKPLSAYPEGKFQIGNKMPNKMPSPEELLARYGNMDTRSKKP